MFASLAYCRRRQLTVNPPSIAMVCPVMKEAAGKQRNATKEDTSSGSPIRPRGVLEMKASRSFSSFKCCRK